MEQTTKLNENLQAYIKQLNLASNATTFEEVDKAKVEGLKAFRLFEMQLNRARHDIIDITRRRRSELQADATSRARNVVVETVPSKPVAVKVEKKTTKKTTKKAKK